MERLFSYARFVKLEHTLFSLPLMLSGAFLAAGGMPGARVLLLIIAAGAGARTAALGLNRIIDRGIDSRNPRTSSRELPAGRISLGESVGVVAAGLAVYLVAAWLICPLVLYLSPVPVAVFVAYPYMKRFTPLCHFGVGLALALAPLGGFVAVTCSLAGLGPAIHLSLFTLFWVAGFDIIYATLDEEFDTGAGVYSMVSVYGRGRALVVSAVLHVLAFLELAWLYATELDGLGAMVVLLAAGVLLLIEHRRSADVDLAFFRINAWLGFVVLIFVLAGIYLP